MKDNLTTLVCGKVYAPSSDNPSNTKEYRSFFLRTYCPLDEVYLLLEHLHIEAYAFIVHDKDCDLNGELHESHIHLLVHLCYPSKVRATTIAKYLKSGNTRLEIVRDKYKAYQYLIHANSPDKFQYSLDEVVCNNLDFYQLPTAVTKEQKRASDMSCLLDDVLTLTMRDFALKYGRDGILNYSKYKDFSLRCKSASFRELYTLEDKFALAKECYNSFIKDLHYSFDNKLLYRFNCYITDTLINWASCSPATLIDKLLSAYTELLPRQFDDDFFI